MEEVLRKEGHSAAFVLAGNAGNWLGTQGEHSSLRVSPPGLRASTLLWSRKGSFSRAKTTGFEMAPKLCVKILMAKLSVGF